jgi:hypothetical protein
VTSRLYQAVIRGFLITISLFQSQCRPSATCGGQRGLDLEYLGIFRFYSDSHLSGNSSWSSIITVIIRGWYNGSILSRGTRVKIDMNVKKLIERILRPKNVLGYLICENKEKTSVIFLSCWVIFRRCQQLDCIASNSGTTDELWIAKDFEESGCGLIEVLSRHFLEGLRITTKILSEFQVSRPRFQPRTARIRVKCVTAFTLSVIKATVQQRELLYPTHTRTEGERIWSILSYHVTRLQDGVTGNRFLGIVTVSRYFEATKTYWKDSRQRPDRLWDPPSLLSYGYQALFPRSRAARAWNWPLTST